MRRRLDEEREPESDRDEAEHDGRVPVQALIDYIEGGHSLHEFLDDFPTVSRDIAIAALEQAKGNVAEAEILLRRSLYLKEELLGSMHPDVAISANNLAMLLAGEHLLNEAQILLSRAIEILDQSVSSDHPKLVTCRENYRLVAFRMIGA